MKKVWLLAAACALGTAGLVLLNQNGDNGAKQIEAPVVSKGLYPSVAAGCEKPGNTIYIVDQAGTEGNFGDSYGGKAGLHFYNKSGGDIVKEAYTSALPFKYYYKDQYSKNCYTYVGIVPSQEGVTTWQYVEIVRLNKDWDGTATKESFASNKWEISAELSLEAGKNSFYVYQSKGTGDGVLDVWPEATTSAEQGLFYMTQGDGNKIWWRSDWDNLVCAGDSTDSATVVSQWATAKAYFSAFGADVKGALSNAVADPTEQPFDYDTKSVIMGGLAARYDHIARKYNSALGEGYNFADRSL